MVMKRIVSALFALSVLAGVAGSAAADFGWAADAVGAARCLPFDPLKRTDRKAGPAAKPRSRC